jgi:hypothetical protein
MLNLEINEDEACSDAQLWECSEQRHRSAHENGLYKENVTGGGIGILKLRSV